MTDFSLKLSAYLDGELDEAEAAEIEARLATDPEAQAELDALMAADAMALGQFDEMLSDPVPLALAQQIKDAPLERPAGETPAAKTPVPSNTVSSPEPANMARRPLWGMVAASLAIFVVGLAGGYGLKSQTAPVQIASTWLQDIADYHAVYASQGRHLVEVSADESDHIEAWLGNTIGAQFSIPDLSQFDLTFEGGRLLVAGGNPVAQLMYRQADGTVIALCLQQNTAPQTGVSHSGTPAFKAQRLNGFDLVSWTSDKASYVVLGPADHAKIAQIAVAAAMDI